MLLTVRATGRPLPARDVSLREGAVLDRERLRKTLNFLTVIGVSTVVTWISDYNWPTRTGNLSIILFLAASIYLPAKWLRKWFHFRGVQVYYAWLLRWHCVLNTAAFVVVAVHAYTVTWANHWLWISLYMMGILTIGGFLLRLKYPPKVRKGLYVLHTQQIAFVVLLYVTLKGHYVFPWLP